MKPKEFDELIRQKFDQNDFEYNPRNWERLNEQMDGRSKKRSVMMWWLMPLAGIAASVAMAMGVTGLLRQAPTGMSGENSAFVQSGNYDKQYAIQNEPSTSLISTNEQDKQPVKAINNSHTANNKKSVKETFAISLDNAIGFAPNSHAKGSKFEFKDELIPKKEKKALVTNEGYHTFKPEDEAIKKPAKTSIILDGGINRGNENSGYMVGATIRRMVTDKVFIESDVAFANSSNTQATAVFVPSTGTAARSAARSTSVQDGPLTVSTPAPRGTIKNENESYNLSYIQVSPSLGYKLMKKMSIGAGPDFQQMLADNRPTQSTVDRNNVSVAPTFDIGFIGKTEYSVTKRVKAGVIYRKGINNILTPMDKYIDRDYLQFQLKCTIFNK